MQGGEHSHPWGTCHSSSSVCSPPWLSQPCLFHYRDFDGKVSRKHSKGISFYFIFYYLLCFVFVFLFVIFCLFVCLLACLLACLFVVLFLVRSKALLLFIFCFNVVGAQFFFFFFFFWHSSWKNCLRSWNPLPKRRKPPSLSSRKRSAKKWELLLMANWMHGTLDTMLIWSKRLNIRLVALIPFLSVMMVDFAQF